MLGDLKLGDFLAELLALFHIGQGPVIGPLGRAQGLGRNLDAVLLSDVMYGEAGAKDLLRNAWNSLSDNGLLIVRGYYADPGHSGPLFGALFAVKLLVDDPHQKNMSISDVADNVTAAGFTIQKTAPLTERSYVLVARKQTT